MGFPTTVVEKRQTGRHSCDFEYFITTVKEYKKIGIVLCDQRGSISEEQKAQVTERLLYDHPVCGI